jgi:hypothetical protein
MTYRPGLAWRHRIAARPRRPTARSRPDRAVFAEQRFFTPRRWKTEVETYTSVVVVLSVALLLVAVGLVRSSSSRGGRDHYRHVGAGVAEEAQLVRVSEPHRVLVAAGVVAGAALARGAGLPPARHRIAARGPGRGQVREVSEREVSEA